MKKLKKGITSVEASALLVSEGRTKDPDEAEVVAAERHLDMEDMAAVREMMGFDFKIKHSPTLLHLYSKERPRVSARAKIIPGEVDTYGNIVSQDLIERLVVACVQLKEKHDAALARLKR